MTIMYGTDVQDSHRLEMSCSEKKAFRSVSLSDMFRGVASPACPPRGKLHIKLIPRAVCPRAT